MNAHKSIQESRIEAFQYQQTANYSAAASLKVMLRGSSEDNQTPLGADASPRGQKRKHDEEDEETPDEVRLYEDGFKDRYYESKFHVGPDNLAFREHVGHEYVLGLAWVLQYYYQGCPSWEWFFPYHYACFASDFTNIADMDITFPKNTQPFTPLEQLMAVFPAASRSHVPEPWGRLMLDSESNIADFYPSDFMIDLNGKKFAWQGVALLPFVDEKRLKDTLKNYYHTLTDAEKKRNSRGEAVLYTGRKHKSYKFMRAMYTEGIAEETVIEALEFEGMGGNILCSTVCVEEGGVLETPVNGLPNLYSVNVVSVSYRDPKYSIDYVFKSQRLPNAQTPTPQLKSQDLAKIGSFRGSHNMGPRTHRAFVAESGHRKINFALQSQDQGYRGQQNQYNSRGNYGGRPPQNESNYAYRGAPYAPTYNGPPFRGHDARQQHNQGRDNTYSAPSQLYSRQSYGYETVKQNDSPRYHLYQAPRPRGGMPPTRGFDDRRNQSWDQSRGGRYRGRGNDNYRR